MQFKQGFTNGKNILSELIYTVCFDGDLSDTWLLIYPLIDPDLDIKTQLEGVQKAIISTIVDMENDWKYNVKLNFVEDEEDSKYYYAQLNDNLVIDSTTLLQFHASRSGNYYKVERKEDLEDFTYFVDYPNNRVYITSNFVDGAIFTIDYKYHVEEQVRYNVEFDFTQQNVIRYRFSDELNEDETEVICSQVKNLPWIQYFIHSQDLEKYPMYEWIPFEYYCNFDSKTINFVSIEEPVHQEQYPVSWLYIGALDEISDALTKDKKGNFGGTSVLTYPQPIKPQIFDYGEYNEKMGQNTDLIYPLPIVGKTRSVEVDFGSGEIVSSFSSSQNGNEYKVFSENGGTWLTSATPKAGVDIEEWIGFDLGIANQYYIDSYSFSFSPHTYTHGNWFEGYVHRFLYPLKWELRGRNNSNEEWTIIHTIDISEEEGWDYWDIENVKRGMTITKTFSIPQENQLQTFKEISFNVLKTSQIYGTLNRYDTTTIYPLGYDILNNNSRGTQLYFTKVNIFKGEKVPKAIFLDETTNYLTMYRTKGGAYYQQYPIAYYTQYEFENYTPVAGISNHMMKYMSSKIVAYHLYDRERGYLRNVVATDGKNKDMGDPFVKWKETDKETNFVYIDLMMDSKDILNNSPATLKHIAIQSSPSEEERSKPISDITFEYKDTEQDIVLKDSITYSNVHSAWASAPREIILGQEPDEEKYILIGKDLVRQVITRDGVPVIYTFEYSQRFGDFTIYFKNSDETLDVLEEIVFEDKADFKYTNDIDYIQYSETDKYKIDPNEKLTVYFTASSKDDNQYHIYHYNLITNDFFVYFKDIDTNLDVLPRAEASDVSHIKVVAPDIIPPDENGFNKMVLVTSPNEILIIADEMLTEQSANFYYRLLKSVLTFYFREKETEKDLLDPIVIEANNFTQSSDEYLHLENWDDDEYYWRDEDEVDSKTLITSDDELDQEYTFYYNRLKGDITFNFVDNEDKIVFPPSTYLQVPSIEHRAETFKYIDSNVVVYLNEDEENPIRLISLPENHNPSHTFHYTREILPATADLEIDTQCEFQDGMMYALYETVGDTDRVVKVIPQNAIDGTYTIKHEEITFTIDQLHYIQDDHKRLKWNCKIEVNNYQKERNKLYTIGAINTMTNEHICDYGFISYSGYNENGLVSNIERRKLTHHDSYADWRKKPTGPDLQEIINTDTTYPREFNNIFPILSIDLNSYLTAEVFSINQIYTSAI